MRSKDVDKVIIRNICDKIQSRLKRKSNIINSAASIRSALPFTFIQLREHLENLFEPWMTWENYSAYNAGISKKWEDLDLATWKWQVCHINDFEYLTTNDSNFKKHFALSNLKPISSKASYGIIQQSSKNKKYNNIVTDTHKTCSICKQLLPFEDFNLRNGSISMVRSECKNCQSLANTKYTENYIREHGIIKFKENRNEASKKSNKKRRKIINEKESQKIKNDPNFKIRKTLSHSIRQAIKKNGAAKNKKSMLKYLPYTIEELKQHLQDLFEPWMNWDNWSTYDPKTWDDNNSSTWTWQLDHIIPHSMFKYTSIDDRVLKECWALENLRPLSAKQNNSDGVSKTRHINT